MPRFRKSMFTLAMLAAPAIAALPQTSQAQIFIGIRVGLAPPPLPVYVQPPLPGPDYIWTPGFWAWDGDYGDYYWVPGTWVQAPRPGFLWTPGWWGWDNGFYSFHSGYWGPHIGYYGGVNYGFGYTGLGFEGGYWNGPHYFYNRTVNNVTNVNITNVYTKTVIVNRTTVNNVSYNGGPGGVVARPTSAQMAAEHEVHIQATPLQTRHIQAARTNRALFASANHGSPPVAATVRPGMFNGPGIVRARNAPNPHLQRSSSPGPEGAPTAGRPFVQPMAKAASQAHNPPGEAPGSARVDAPFAQGRPGDRPPAPMANKKAQAHFVQPHGAPQPHPAPPRPPHDHASARSHAPTSAPPRPHAGHHDDHRH